MSDTLIIGISILLALLPAILWYFLYRWLDHKEPESPRAMIMTGLLGIVSTLPVFALQWIFKEFPEFNFMNTLQFHLDNYLLFTIIFLLFVAVIEELVKAASAVTSLEYYQKEFNQVVDGIVYGASVALGFSFAENIYYFYSAYISLGMSQEFFAVFTIRSLGTMLGHTLFTGIFGFYYARAYLAPFITEEMRKKKVWHDTRHTIGKAITLHATRRSILPHQEHAAHDEHPGIVIIEGFLIAVMTHLIYNVLVKVEIFGKTWTFLIVPFLFVLAWSVWRLFFKKLYTRVLVALRARKSDVVAIGNV